MKILLMIQALMPMMVLAEVSLSNIKVFSGYPWQDVVIGYTVSGGTDQPMALEVYAKDNVSGKVYECKRLEGVDLSSGDHVIKWDASIDGAKFKSEDVVFTVRIVPAPLYCVIDLSGGFSAERYEVKALDDVPSDGWTDEYKTTKLVLRRIKAGSFKMLNLYDVTLTKPFYIGVFEVTQKQYSLVMGSNPSAYKGDMRPVECVSYDKIRGGLVGAGWPMNNAVDARSFLGRLRAKTGLDLDLPTEAQWEYACRAGTTSKFNNGGSSEGDLKKIGRYHDNMQDGKGGCYFAHTKVGSYLPNAWGLYDMHGNVFEWCLDWSCDIQSATDPRGGISGLYRVLRGGCWYRFAEDCTSSYKGRNVPSYEIDYYGFRLSRTIQQ